MQGALIVTVVVEVRDGDEVGYGIIEYGVGKGYALYESVQMHPPI